MLRGLIKDSTIYIVIVVAWRMAGFITMPIYTRLLSPADYGIIEAVNRIVDIVSLFLGLGLAESVLRHYYTANDEKERRRLVGTAFTIVGIIAFSGATVTLAISPLISKLVFGHVRYVLYINLLMLSMFVDFVFNLASTVLRARRKLHIVLAMSMTRLVFHVTTNFVLIAVLRWGVYGAFVSNFLTASMCAVFMGLPVWARYGLIVDRRWFVSFLRFGLPLVPASLAHFIIHFGDRFFLVRYASESQLGIYSLAYKFGMLVSIGQSVISNAWWPLAYKEWEEKRDVRLLRKPLAFIQLALALLGSAIILFSGAVIHLMSARAFWEARQYIGLLVLSYWLYALQSVFSMGAKLAKRTDVYGVAQAAAAPVSLVSTFVLIHYLGVWGAVWATVISMLTIVSLTALASSRVLHIPQDKTMLLLGLFILLLSMAVDWFTAFATLPGIAIRSLALLGILIGTAYSYTCRYRIVHPIRVPGSVRCAPKVPGSE
jgi:O-antigen/teichoic acid export membrane protein